jgi:tungstate transport system ATP-binding protein
VDQPHLEVKNLTLQRNGRDILDIEELSVNRGELFVIIGPNGAGKSTLLRILDLIERPTSGQVLINGEKIDDSSDKLAFRRKMAMVFQDSLLFSGSVSENVAYGLRARKCHRTEIAERIEKILAKLDISHLASRKSSELSGGEAQRVSLARALVLEPEILLLDEPLASLDPPTREGLRVDLERLVREEKLTTIYVTHDRTEALMLADRVAVMIDGRILQIGTPDDVFNYPKNEEVAKFVGVETILPGIVSSTVDGLATVEVKNNKIEVVTDAQVGEKVILCIRPEEVTITVDQERQRTSARNRFHSTVTKITRLGALVRVALDCGFPLTSVVTKQSAEQLDFQEGQEVLASFKATAVHVIKKSK